MPTKWRVRFDYQLYSKQHALGAGFGRALATAIAVNTFETLELSAALWEHGNEWLPLHTGPHPVRFERQHHGLVSRGAYNQARYAEVMRTRRTVVGELDGYRDLFVPIAKDGEVVGMIVVGPFATEPPTAERLTAQWLALTGGRPIASDPGFAAFAEQALSALVLERGPGELIEFVECLAALLGENGDSEALLNRAEVLRTRLGQARIAEENWRAAHEMLDERSARLWQFSNKALQGLGLGQMPDDLLTVLGVSRDRAADSIEEFVRWEAFQRACVRIAQKMGDVIAGKIGQRGVVFLSRAQGSLRARRSRLESLADKAALLGTRTYRLRLHFGASLGTANAPLFQRFPAALAAAEAALTSGERLLWASAELGDPRRSLRLSRRRLFGVSEEYPAELSARFERYIESVVREVGQNMEALREPLNAGFEIVALPLVHSGTLDEKSYDDLSEALARATRDAVSAAELIAAHRRVISGISEAVQRPVAARHARGIHGVLEHIDRHLAEPLGRDALARLAGMAPAQFSRVFKASQGLSFEEYLQDRRLARATDLLEHTGLGVARIAQMSGFNSSQYFCRVFKAAKGTTTRAYRKVQNKVTKMQ